MALRRNIFSLPVDGLKGLNDSLPRHWKLYVFFFWFCIALVNATFLRIVAPYEPGPLQHLAWQDFMVLVLPRWILWVIISLMLPLLMNRIVKSFTAFIFFALAVILFASLWDGFYRMLFLGTDLNSISLWRHFTHNLGKNIIQDFCLLLLTCIGLVAWSSVAKVHSLSDKILTLQKVNAELVDHASLNEGELQPKQLPVRISGKIKFIDSLTIDHLRASGSYVEICTPTRRYLVVGNLKGFEAKLDPQEFYRIHRSAIIRKAAIESMESLPNGEYRIMTKLGVKLRLSRSYRNKVALLK